MEPTLTALVATTLMATTLLLGGVLLVKSASDLPLLCILVFCQFYGFRAFLLSAGWDTPSPDEYFATPEVPALVTITTLAVTGFLGLTFLVAGVWLRSGMPGWGPCFGKGELSLRRMRWVMLVLTGISLAISAVLVVRFGGVGALVMAAKFDKALAGLFFLRIAPTIGAVVSVGLFLETYARRTGLALRLLSMACILANGMAVFLWGTRSLFVVMAATIILGLHRQITKATRRRPAREITPRPKVFLRLGLAVLLVVLTAAGLRIARDTLMHGEVLDVYADASPARQVSLAVNATYYDAALLSIRDWPRSHEYRHGEDFYVGALGLVPRLLWEDKPDAIAPGRWFRQLYEPKVVNGWPMGAPGLWYLNFGWWGMVLGAVISGVLLGAMTRAQRDRPRNGYNISVAVVVGVFVLGLGWDSDMLVKLLMWVVPLSLIARWVAPAPSSGRSAPSPASTRASSTQAATEAHEAHEAPEAPGGSDQMPAVRHHLVDR